MPFYRELNIAEGIRVGLWKITEKSGELEALAGLNEADRTVCSGFRNDQRRRHWLAYRAALRHMLAPLPVKIAYDPNGKPLLDPPSHHISVSHAGVFAAAVYSEKQRVGIDIEQVRERIVRVKERFLSEHELVHVSGDTSLDRLYVYWGGKEALYKLRGVPGLDFRNEIQIHPFDYLCDENQECTAHMVIEGEREEYRLFYSCVEDYMLVVGWKG